MPPGTTIPLRIGDVIMDTMAMVSGSAYPFGGKLKPAHECLRPLRVEAIGADWVVARSSTGKPVFADVDPESLAVYRESRGGPFPEDL